MSELDSILEAYLEESRELLFNAENQLLSLENNPQDLETINALFRSIHTIKGTSGMFGFHFVVDFTHVLENVLDKLRSNQIPLTRPLLDLLLKARDHTSVLVDAAVQGSPNEKLIQLSSQYIQELKKLSESNQEQDLKKETSIDEESFNQDTLKQESFQNSSYYISLRPNQDIFINGLDPYPILRYLKELGEIQFVRVVIRHLPSWEDYNPEKCYLGFEICLFSKEPIEKIKKAFEFLEYDSLVLILPPYSTLKDFKKHIDALPEDEIFLTNIMRESGIINQKEHVMLLESYQGFIRSEINQNIIEKQNDNKGGLETLSSYLRVDSSKIDHLIGKVGELVIAEASLSQIFQNIEDSLVIESLNSLSRLIHEIREISLKLRMVPIGESFQRYNRLVRDLGKELGKKVKLHIRGGETELDKTIMEKISDPMVHLIRNALDHGIESEEERIQVGKEPVGNIFLNAFHDTGNIVIEIQDDGRGIQHDKVLEKAIEKGIAKPEENYSKEEIEKFLFHPGFSTADTVSNVSGRGVGLDVVQKNIESLRGFILIESAKGKGTKFTIRLPLTLAIIDGFLMGSNEDLYVMPLDMVRECVEFNQKDHFFNLRGSILPYIRLDEYFYGKADPKPRENIVVTEFQGKKFGLVVDRLYGEIQTVIKPLAKIFENVRGIGGSTTLGDGKIAFILDIADLYFSIKEKEEALQSYTENQTKE